MGPPRAPSRPASSSSSTGWEVEGGDIATCREEPLPRAVVDRPNVEADVRYRRCVTQPAHGVGGTGRVGGQHLHGGNGAACHAAFSAHVPIPWLMQSPCTQLHLCCPHHWPLLCRLDFSVELQEEARLGFASCLAGGEAQLELARAALLVAAEDDAIGAASCYGFPHNTWLTGSAAPLHPRLKMQPLCCLHFSLSVGVARMLA